MDYFKISVSIIYFFIIFINAGYGQSSEKSKFIVEHLYKPLSNSENQADSSALFIIITNKSCARCFTSLCEYSDQHYKKYARKYGIVFMNKSLVSTLSYKKKYKNEIACLDDVYFYFVDEYDMAFVEEITHSPTPQLILKSQNEYSYLPYHEVLKLIE